MTHDRSGGVAIDTAELERAIAVIKDATPERAPWHVEDFSDAGDQAPDIYRHIATILNAVVSGCLVLAHRKAEAWQPISSAPFHTPVIVQVGRMTFPAMLRGNAAMDENGQDCAQWQAVNEGEHPPCWSDGACWASNADGLTSLQPTEWKPTTAAEGGSDERA